MIDNRIEVSVPAEDIAAADRLVAPGQKPYGYARNPGPVETKTPFFGLWRDKVNADCVLILTRWMDGTGIFLRYPRHLLVMGA